MWRCIADCTQCWECRIVAGQAQVTGSYKWMLQLAAGTRPAADCSRPVEEYSHFVADSQ